MASCVELYMERSLKDLREEYTQCFIAATQSPSL